MTKAMRYLLLVIGILLPAVSNCHPRWSDGCDCITYVLEHTADSGFVTMNQIQDRVDSLCRDNSAKLQQKIDEYAIKRATEVDKIADDHIKFLTDKMSFLTTVITIVFSLFGIASIVVTVIFSTKIIEYRDAYREMGVKADMSLATIQKAEKKISLVQTRACYQMAKNSFALYKMMNDACPLSNTMKELAERAVRRENMRAFLINLRYGLNCALEAKEDDFVRKFVGCINPFLLDVTINNWKNDFNSMKIMISKSKWPNAKLLFDALDRAITNVKMNASMKKAYTDLQGLLA